MGFGRGRTPGRGTPDRDDAPRTGAAPGKQTLVDQQSSEIDDVPRWDSLDDLHWETIDQLEAHLGEGSPVMPHIVKSVAKTTGADVSHARVHTGPVAAKLAAKKNATAFAVGGNIVIGSAAPAPGTPEGDALLAHELAHVAQQSQAATDPEARKRKVGEEDAAAERDAGIERLGNFAGAIGDVMRTQLQLQRCVDPPPVKVTALSGKAAEQKLKELGGSLVTNPDYTGDRKAIAGSNIQYALRAPVSPTMKMGMFQWTHDGPEGYHAQSIQGVGRPDGIPSAAVGPNGMFINSHDVGATTMQLPKPGTYTTDAWVRVGIDNNGSLEGYDLHVPVVVEVQGLGQASAGAYAKVAGADKEDSFQKSRDQMDMQMTLLKPGGPDEQNKGHEAQVATSAANPTAARPGSIAFEAKDGRKDKSKPLTYHWYVSAQTNEKLPEQLAGKPLVAVASRQGYDFGTGTKIDVPTDRAGFWVVWYQARDAAGEAAGEASYLQTILGADDLKALDKMSKHVEKMDELGRKVDGPKVPITGVHVSQANAIETRLRLFIGKQAGDANSFILIDTTPGLDPKANRFEYTANTGAAAIEQFVSNNKYPKGQMQFRVGANEWNISTGDRTIETDGVGVFDRLSSGLSIGGMAVLGAGIIAAPFTRGQSLQVAVVLSGGLTAAGAAVSLYERLQHAEVSGTGVAMDVAMIASGLLNAGGGLRAVRAGPAVLLAGRTTRFLLWANVGLDSVMALLITVEGVERISEILARTDMTEEAKRGEVVRIVTNLVMAGMMIAVSAGQLKEFRTKVEGGVGRKLPGLADDAVIGLAMLDEATLKTLKPVQNVTELSQLAGALREEPALINVLKGNARIPQALALMKGATSSELKFALMRTAAHEAGVAVGETERFVNILRNTGVTAEKALLWGEKGFIALASNSSLLTELERIAPLVKAGRITGFDNWLTFGATKGATDMARTVGELREAERQLALRPGSKVEIGGDLTSPKNPAKPSDPLPSFDLEVNQGGAKTNVEVGSIDAPVKGGKDMTPGVGHAADKVKARIDAGVPLQGRNEATIRVRLAKKVAQGKGGDITIFPNGDRKRITKEKPPREIDLDNIFDEFAAQIPASPNAKLLDGVNVVDADSGALLAHYEKVSGTWTRMP